MLQPFPWRTLSWFLPYAAHSDFHVHRWLPSNLAPNGGLVEADSIQYWYEVNIGMIWSQHTIIVNYSLCRTTSWMIVGMCICILQISYKLYHHVKRWISAGQVYFSVLWCQQHLWMKTVLGTTIHKIKEQSVHHHINLFKNSSTKNQQFPPSYLGMAIELLWPSPPKLPAVPPRHWPTRVVLGAQALRLDLQNEATNDEHQDCKCLTPEAKFLDGNAHQKLRTHHGRFGVAGYHSLNPHTKKQKQKEVGSDFIQEALWKFAEFPFVCHDFQLLVRLSR